MGQRTGKPKGVDYIPRHGEEETLGARNAEAAECGVMTCATPGWNWPPSSWPSTLHLESTRNAHFAATFTLPDIIKTLPVGQRNSKHKWRRCPTQAERPIID